MKPNKLLLLVGLLASLGVAPVYASVSASASFSDFSVTLYDLNPLDGVTPSLSWDTPGAYGNYTAATVYAENLGLVFSDNGPSLGMDSTSTARIRGGMANSSITVSSVPGNPIPFDTLSASGSAYASRIEGSLTFGAAAYAGSPEYRFTLSANTLAVFGGTATTQATTTIGYDQVNGQSERAYASATMLVSGMDGVTGFQHTSDSLFSDASFAVNYYWDSVANNWRYVYTPQTASNSGRLGGAFLNLSSATQNGYLQLNVFTSGSTNIAAVPEPESYAMFLAGLGIVGAVVRRRRPD